MDVLTFMNEYARMCNFYNGQEVGCGDCPLADLNCELSSDKAPKSLILEKVEEWSKAHPKKTRQSEFLKMFPSAKIAKRGFLLLFPCDVDTTIDNSKCMEDCSECCERFWNEEIGDDT